MTLIEINNGPMSARISSLGAELVSLRRDNTEYLWQGDPAFWHGQSPLLFPVCGSCWNGTYRIGDREFQIPKHGFAKSMEFDVVNRTDSTVTLALHSDNDTLAVFPFPFFLFVTYRLADSSIEVEWMVQNQGDDTMYFAIGAHPAFFLPAYDPTERIHGYFKFDTDKPITYLIPTEKGCVDADRPLPLPLDDEATLPITSRTFDIDTYVIEAADIRSCTLLTPDRKPYLSVEFNMPVLSLWAPTLSHPDCPFVAIEPWAGSCDSVGFDGQLPERRHINALDPGQFFRNSHTLRLHSAT